MFISNDILSVLKKLCTCYGVGELSSYAHEKG